MGSSKNSMLTKLLALGGVAACVTVCLALKRGHHTRRVIIRTHAGREPLGFVRLSFDDVLGGITYADLRERQSPSIRSYLKHTASCLRAACRLRKARHKDSSSRL